MIEHVVKIRSSICSQLMKSTLLKGTLYAALGVIILVLAGAFLPSETLTTFGLPIFIMGIGLITFGLLPYRRLTSIEKCPNELWIKESCIPISEEKSQNSGHQNLNISGGTSSKDLASIKKEIPLSCRHLITFRCRNKDIFALPAECIQSYTFVESPSNYGISICLANPAPEKILIFDQSFCLTSFENEKTEANAPGKKMLFLPYFSKRAYYQLAELLDVNN